MTGGLIDQDKKPQLTEDEGKAGIAQVKSEEDFKAESVGVPCEDDRCGEEADKSFDPVEKSRMSR